MIQSVTCPDQNRLIDFLLGKMEIDDLPALESHLEGCDACEETMRGLNASDTFSHYVEQSTGSVEPEEEEGDFVNGLISQVQQRMALHSGGLRLDERTIEVVRQVQESEDPESIGRIGHYE